MENVSKNNFLYSHQMKINEKNSKTECQAASIAGIIMTFFEIETLEK